MNHEIRVIELWRHEEREMTEWRLDAEKIRKLTKNMNKGRR